MSLFKKKRGGQSSTEPAEASEAAETGAETEAAPGEAAADKTVTGSGLGARGAASGPKDISEAPEGVVVADFGAIKLPVVEGVKVSAEVSKAGGQVMSVSLNKDGSKMQLQAFAAPKTRGIWEEVRRQIIGSAQKQGGSGKEVDGRFGKALALEVPVTTAQGRTGKNVLRIVGADGPRWLLRGTISGKAARDEAALAEMEELFTQVIVDRGEVAMPPREPLPLRLPGAASVEAVAEAEDPMALLRRGPEISEVR
ncbi:MAG: DUF3710 domain-containing protein [Bifidobacteriaceae bacterium]|jgi:hypothetical protein|nr:DUF3710 domain-containing protein [Bifidobacteriaceae bacterium]